MRPKRTIFAAAVVTYVEGNPLDKETLGLAEAIQRYGQERVIDILEDQLNQVRRNTYKR